MWTRELRSSPESLPVKLDDQDEFPEGTVNYLVNENLDELSRRLKEYESPQGEEVKEENHEDS